MSSKKFSKASQIVPDDEGKMDMSPMIDMVFLLLIFFMIASTIIEIKQAPDINPPIASNTKAPTDTRGRIVINIYPDGDFYDINGRGQGGKKLSEEDITILCKEVSEELKPRGITPKLHLRGDQSAPILSVKKVTKAAAAGGVNTVVFSSFSKPPQT